MTDTKMLQSILDRVSGIDQKVDKGFKRMDEEFIKVNNRIDSLGEEIASIDDDAPTGEDFYKLKRRVRRLELKLAN